MCQVLVNGISAVRPTAPVLSLIGIMLAKFGRVVHQASVGLVKWSSPSTRRKAIECPLCGHSKAHKHGKTSNDHLRYLCPACHQTFCESFDSLYYRLTSVLSKFAKSCKRIVKAVVRVASVVRVDLPTTPW